LSNPSDRCKYKMHAWKMWVVNDNPLQQHQLLWCSTQVMPIFICQIIFVTTTYYYARARWGRIKLNNRSPPFLLFWCIHIKYVTIIYICAFYGTYLKAYPIRSDINNCCCLHTTYGNLKSIFESNHNLYVTINYS
jgi:hypothetical protein